MALPDFPIDTERLRLRPFEAGDHGALLALHEREDLRFAGDVMLFHRSTTHRAAEVGYVFDPAFHGRGFATEAAEALLRIAFEQVGYHRVYGRLDARNTASARVLEKVGMRREAHLVENEWFKGEWTDEVIYGILDREWPTAPGRRRSP